MLDEITNQEFTSDEDAARYIKEKMQEQIEKDSEELIRLLGRILSYCEEREKEQVDGER